MANGWGGRRAGAGRKPKPSPEMPVKRGPHGGARPGAGRPRKALQRMSVQRLLSMAFVNHLEHLARNSGPLQDEARQLLGWEPGGADVRPGDPK
jgi:hypothetical protein